jgi:hypothetical protein
VQIKHEKRFAKKLDAQQLLHVDSCQKATEGPLRLTS